jgi:hypothetical protein
MHGLPDIRGGDVFLQSLGARGQICGHFYLPVTKTPLLAAGGGLVLHSRKASLKTTTICDGVERITKCDFFLSRTTKCAKKRLFQAFLGPFLICSVLQKLNVYPIRQRHFPLFRTTFAKRIERLC